jgi:hypothetical protein
MIINSAPQNEAILSNVGEIGEFRIRNSAKAFSILSSGLYANKIRAIVRELSCNAVDSHVAAGKGDTPFDVHLPNALEAHFSIRDYGTGLNHDQVTNIYTTYFESTKTASNEFIGALGLGSKSPFSYTDNFTVTTVKDGWKGIYSAFINEQGVPSIAQMMQEETTDPNGVEIKFSVNDRWDFGKFEEEAQNVYRYFKLRPVVSGVDFEFDELEYETRDIVPGVHSRSGSHRYHSVAVMGNIAYPIEVPNAESALGDLQRLLNCGLEMHFNIGEVDFQASREGLSYIPQTIASIKSKLEEVNARLATFVAEEADKIDNLWDRAAFLLAKSNSNLWHAAVCKYLTDTTFPLIDASRTHYLRLKEVPLEVTALAETYNIEIHAFRKNRGSQTCNHIRPSREWELPAGGTEKVLVETWEITPETSTCFVVNDTKVGAFERAKHHWRQVNMVGDTKVWSQNVLVLSAKDKEKSMDTAAFFAALHSPKDDRVMLASTLTEKIRAARGGTGGKNVTIMQLQQRGGAGYYKSKEMVWRDAGKADEFSSKNTYYYLPLSGYTVVSELISSPHNFFNDVQRCGVASLANIDVYGVRKTDIEYIKTQKNWINIEEHVTKVLNKIDVADLSKFVAKEVDLGEVLKYNKSMLALVDANSPYAKFVMQTKDMSDGEFSRNSLETLCNRFAKGKNFSFDALVTKLTLERDEVNKRYPLLESVSRYSFNKEAVAEYINLVDAKKGI